jgi:hypothetical protein
VWWGGSGPVALLEEAGLVLAALFVAGVPVVAFGGPFGRAGGGCPADVLSVDFGVAACFVGMGLGVRGVKPGRSCVLLLKSTIQAGCPVSVPPVAGWCLLGCVWGPEELAEPTD